MLDLEFLLEEDEFEFLNELYVGETSFINDLTEEVSRARSPYIGKTKRPIKGNKDFIRIGDMIAEEFGFASVTFIVPYDLSMNAYTYPITNSMGKSSSKARPKFTNGSGFKYDVSGLHILVAVTAGVWYSEEFTDREVVAAMLHEIGHSFVSQSEDMAKLEETTRLAYVILRFYNLFIDIFTLNPNVIGQDIKEIFMSSNKGKEIMNKVTRQCANNSLFSAFNNISYIGEYVKGTVKNIFVELSSFMSGYTYMAMIPTEIVNKIFAILFRPYRLFKSLNRSQEYLSDSFANMYGLGPELSSFLGKIEYNPSATGSKVEKITSTTPVLGALNEVMKVPLLMVMHGTSTHPSTPARMSKMIDELNKELKNSDLNPKAKEELKKDIKELEKIKDEFVSLSKSSDCDAEMVKRAWSAFISSNTDELNNAVEKHLTDLETRNKYMRNK